MKTLVLYASKHGQTEKIALRIAEVMCAQGVDAVAQKAEGHMDLDPSDFDAVVIGASIHAGHHQREVLDWVKAHGPTLNAMPSALFSVSLSAAEDTDESRTANRKYLDDFSDETGWLPTKAISFAGALQYLEYDFMTKLVMRLISKHGHHPTDSSRDYEYTDWDQVDGFARACAALGP